MRDSEDAVRQRSLLDYYVDAEEAEDEKERTEKALEKVGYRRRKGRAQIVKGVKKANTTAGGEPI